MNVQRLAGFPDSNAAQAECCLQATLQQLFAVQTERAIHCSWVNDNVAHIGKSMIECQQSPKWRTKIQVVRLVTQAVLPFHQALLAK